MIRLSLGEKVFVVVMILGLIVTVPMGIKADVRRTENDAELKRRVDALELVLWDRNDARAAQMHQLQNWTTNFDERLKRIEGREPPLAKPASKSPPMGACFDRVMPRID